MTLDDWREVIELDLTGQFLCCREAVRRFRAQDSTGRPFRAAGSIISMIIPPPRVNPDSSGGDFIGGRGRASWTTPRRIAALMLSGEPGLQRHLRSPRVLAPKEVKPFPARGADAPQCRIRVCFANSVGSIERT
jgi:NAD(P)-dependent dehydrogenase (short-subunit alcohol dehydrogenase family)